MYRLYRENPNAVSAGWREFFADYSPRASTPAARPRARAAGRRAAAAPRPRRPAAGRAARRSRSTARRPQPLRGAAARIVDEHGGEPRGADGDVGARGARPSCSRSTARSSTTTSRATRGGKVSFTHLIGYAVLRALRKVPDMNSSFGVVDGKPSVVRHEHVNLGLAIDLAEVRRHRARCSSRTSRTPTRSTSPSFHAAYEDLVRTRAHQQAHRRRLRAARRCRSRTRARSARCTRCRGSCRARA